MAYLLCLLAFSRIFYPHTGAGGSRGGGGESSGGEGASRGCGQGTGGRAEGSRYVHTCAKIGGIRVALGRAVQGKL